VKRGLALVCLVAAVVAGCSTTAAVAPTPQIVYVTAPPQPAPTPMIVYVTPEPATHRPSPSAISHPFTGTFSLAGSTVWSFGRNAADQLECWGSGGYSDIRVGMKVVVKDQAGAIIATAPTEIDPTWKLADHDCRYAFALTLPETSFYSVEVGHRGAQTYSNADLSSAGWHVDLTLGG